MDNPAIIAACRLAFTGFEKNDRSELVRLLSEDVVFDFSDSLPYGGRYEGKVEFLAFGSMLRTSGNTSTTTLTTSCRTATMSSPPS